MNPKLTYDKIIENAKSRATNFNGEVHHIIPKCMGGSNDSNNLVKLTYREHYFCHYLLLKIYPNEYKLLYAFNIMTNDKRHGWIISSKQYARFKLEFNKLNSIEQSKRLLDPEFNKNIRLAFDKFLHSDKNVMMKNLWDNADWRIKKSKLQSEYMLNKWKSEGSKLINSRQKGKCIYYMYSYLCELNEPNPSDELILHGWKLNKGFSNNWMNYYTESEWIESVRNYIKLYPVTKKSGLRSQSQDTINKRLKSRQISKLYDLIVKNQIKYLNSDILDKINTINKYNIKFIKEYFINNDEILDLIKLQVSKFPIDGLIID